jgi:hypothetical protein
LVVGLKSAAPEATMQVGCFTAHIPTRTIRHMGGPRALGAGTERALYLLSRGSCYFPDCTVPAIVFVDDVPISNLEIAHVRGAHPGAARYDEQMDDAARAAFSNLILLCGAHHKLVDRIKPHEYPSGRLLAWKAEREDGAGADLEGVGSINAERFDRMLEDYVSRHKIPLRLHSLEVWAGGGTASESKVFTFPLPRWRGALLSKFLPFDVCFLAIYLRNRGTVQSSVQSIRIMVQMLVDGKEDDELFLFNFMNVNGMPSTQLPARLDSGESGRWFYPLKSLSLAFNELSAPGERNGKRVEASRLYAVATFQSGELLRSRSYPVELLSLDLLSSPS